MALSEFDRDLIDRCLTRAPEAWSEFVDRYIGLVIHTINHTAGSRSLLITEQDIEDYTAEVFLQIINDDFAVLRRFRGNSSLATYLAVIVRRIVVREFIQRRHPRTNTTAAAESDENEGHAALRYQFSLDRPETIQDHQPSADELLANRDVVANLRENIMEGRWYTIRSWDSSSFSPRTIPPRRHMSFHAVGAAIDINHSLNPSRADNVLITNMPDWFVKAWTDAGWCWVSCWLPPR